MVSDIRPMHCLQLGALQQLSRSETQPYKISEQQWRYLLPRIFYRNRRPEDKSPYLRDSTPAPVLFMRWVQADSLIRACCPQFP